MGCHTAFPAAAVVARADIHGGADCCRHVSNVCQDVPRAPLHEPPFQAQGKLV